MKILLVEDDLDLVKVLNKILILNGYIVDCANDGIEALDYLNINSYDLVIMDIMMPRLDGISTLKRLEKMETQFPFYC